MVKVEFFCSTCGAEVEYSQSKMTLKCQKGHLFENICPHYLDKTECARCTRSDLQVSPDGGVQSRLDSRPSLLPPRAVRMISHILGVKARQYGEWNWKRINNADNFDHVLNHAFLHIQGDRSEFHPANLACRALFYLEGVLEKGHDYDLSYLGGEFDPIGALREVDVCIHKIPRHVCAFTYCRQDKEKV